MSISNSYIPLTKTNVTDFIKYSLQQLLQPMPKTGTMYVSYNGNGWFLTHGFSYDGYVYQLFKNNNTGEYGLHMVPKGKLDWDGRSPPNSGIYSSFEDMLSGVSDQIVRICSKSE